MANLNKTDLLVTNTDKFENLKKTIESFYGFKIQKTQYPNSISLTSRKAILETNKGKYFLKEKPEYCSDNLLIEKSSLFQDFCSQNTIHVPKIIKTIQDNYYFEFECKKFFISEYIEGKPFNGSKTDIEKMLIVLSSLNYAGTLFLSNTNLSKKIIEKFDSYKIATLIPDLIRYVRTEEDKKIFNNIQQTMSNLVSEYNLIGNEEYIMAHSDCILFNFIFNRKQVYLIDFDNTKVLPRIHDLAEFFVSATMLNYLAEITNLKRPVFIKPENQFSKIILNTYKNNFSLSKKEIQLFPIIVDIVWLWTVCLSVLKEDYLISDIKLVIETINNKVNREEIIKYLI